MNNETNNFELELEACKEHIGNDEILWMGKPVLSEEDENIGILGGFMVFFSILGAFVFRNTGAYIAAAMFTLFAFFLCGGKDNVDDIRRKNTFYVITNRKIIRKQDKKIDFTYCSFEHNMEVTIHKNGNGTIAFLNLPMPKMVSHEFGKESNPKNFFYIENIPNACEVAKLIRDLHEQTVK